MPSREFRVFLSGEGVHKGDFRSRAWACVRGPLARGLFVWPDAPSGGGCAPAPPFHHFFRGSAPGPGTALRAVRRGSAPAPP
ncbi:hypothetical protein GCM10020221_00480 [Streptomyces thioluteus]|uniref:Uncharacterized protein n=1 Tax=Streptomyces thioluteus TaxID=66431 RepID=A0ABN3WC80_STRTU